MEFHHREEEHPGQGPGSGLKEMAAVDDGTFGQAESFEGAAIPEAWRTEAGGSLRLSEAHYKHGRQSLMWQWAGGSKLIADKPAYLEEAGRSRHGGIRLWIYSETAGEGALTFRFGSMQEMGDKAPRYQFEILVNFTGWRGFNVHFREDGSSGATNRPSEEAPLEIMEVIPPSERQNGAVYFDVVEFVEHIPASRSSDYQMPFARQRTNHGKGGSWDRSFHFSQKKPSLPLNDTITSEQTEGFAAIARRLEDWVYGVNPDLSQEPLKIRHDALQKFIRAGVAQFDELQLKRDGNGTITGLPLFSSRSTHGPEFGQTVSRKIFLPLVLDYKINGNTASCKKALDLFDHFHDQGWAAGSGLETLDHETNRNSGYFYAVFLMRRELKETGRLEREQATVHWFVNVGKTYGTPGVDYKETTSDEVRTRFVYKLMYVLAMEDTPEKVRHMQGLLQWMNHALKIAPGYAGTIKHDYMGFHHRGVYMSAYAPNAYHTAALIIYLLHGTPFALSRESVDNVKQVLLTLRTVTNKYDVPVGISGRFPTKGGITNEVLPAYAYMAWAENPVGRELGGVFMRLWDPDSPYLQEKLFPEASSDSVQYIDTLGGLQLMLQLAEQGLSPELSPQGFWFKPSAALAVLRRDDWMVATKGWSQYVFDFEAHGRRNTESIHKFTEGENVYGRYVSYGAMQILASGDPVNTVDSGYALDSGWDWCRWPGATTIRQPLEEMKVGKNGSGSGMFNENTRSFSDETFVGGVASEGTDGIFAMKLHDTVFDPSFRARKSFFYFGSEIIALGSNICNNDGQQRTETTLFQSILSDRHTPTMINAEAVTEFPFVYGAPDFGPVWLTDPQGNGYVVPDTQGLHLERAVQSSIDHTGSNPTTGSYCTAWIDHGTSPDNAGYEYAVLVQSSPVQVADYAASPPYRVLRKDNQAHIVQHLGAQAIGYVIFDEAVDMDFGDLRKTSAPVIVMEKQREEQLVLSIADPDLRLPKLANQRMEDHVAWTEGKPAKVQVELRGRWMWQEPESRPESATILQSESNFTVIEIECIHGNTIEMSLIGMKAQ